MFRQKNSGSEFTFCLILAVLIMTALIPMISAATPFNESDNGSVILSETLSLTAAPSFTAGDHVSTIAALKVREGPGIAYTVIAGESLGSTGVIVGNFAGGVKADGYSWYVVRYQDGVRGWSAGEYLEKTGSETVSKQRAVPYVHQCYDSEENFDGRWACGATCAVMTAAYFNSIPTWSFQSQYPSAHTSLYGNYISRQYTTPSGEVLGDESDEQTTDASGTIAKGAYGYIHYPSGSAGYQNMVTYLGYHGIVAEADFSPTETEVREILNSGYPVPVSTKLTDAGHWVVITGYTNGGYYIVNDPNGCKPYKGDPSWGLAFNEFGQGALYTWDELQTGAKYMFRIKAYSPPKPEVELLTPKTGDVLNVGMTQVITWSATSSQDIDHVSLEFTSNGGFNWNTISANEANDGSFSWTVPDAPSTNCWIRATAYDTTGQSALDVTDGPFEIKKVDSVKPTIYVNSPNGGEVWTVGSTQQIRWTATDNVGVTGIDLAYSINAGACWIGIASGEPSSGVYSWMIPNTASAPCLVRVTASDAAGNSASDTSDATFEIRQPQVLPTVTLSVPDGGEIWDVGTSQAIRWTTTSATGIDSIDLEYSCDNGITWQTIATNEADDTSYTWQIPNAPSTVCLVRVHAYDGNHKVTDVSGAPFTIQDVDSIEPSIRVESPNKGEIWTVGTNQEIKYSATDNVGVTRIDLAYSANGGASWIGIASGETNSGVYSWMVPSAPSTSSRVKIIAYDAAGNTASDMSDASFEIRQADNPPIEAPVALFETNISSGSAPLAVLFTDLSTGMISNRTWTFGDGGSSNEKNPVHTYVAAGSYAVSLTVRNDGGSGTMSINGCIEVSSSPVVTPKVSILPVSSTLTVGQTQAFTVVLDTLPEGLSGFNITADLLTPSSEGPSPSPPVSCLSVPTTSTGSEVVEMIGVTYPSWAEIPVYSSFPADHVFLKAVDFKDSVKPGATNVTLCTLTVRGDAAGTAVMMITARTVDGDTGGRYEPALVYATLTVQATMPFPNPAGGNFPPPNDLDGDGLFEDLDGNGYLRFNDVVIYYNSMSYIEAHQPLAAFDYDQSGFVGFRDVILLYEAV